MDTMLIKRLIVPALVGTAVLGGGAVAAANGLPARPSLAGAATPDPSAPAAGSVRDQVKACVETKVAAGGARRTAVKDCIVELGRSRGTGTAALHAIKGATHADLTVPVEGGAYEIVQVDRGKVTAASPSSITILRADGPTVTVTLSPSTVYRGSVSAAADVKVGDQVVTVAKDGAARTVAEKPAKPAKAGRTKPSTPTAPTSPTTAKVPA